MLVLLLACTQPTAPPLYRLKILPQLPANELELMDTLEHVQITLMTPSGDASQPIDLGKPVSGQKSKEEGPDQEIGWVEATGFVEGQEVAWGRTPMLDDTLKSSLLLAENDQIAQMQVAKGGLFGAAVIPDGNGDFLVMGGTVDGKTTGTIRRFSLKTLDETLSMEEESELPDHKSCSNCGVTTALAGAAVIPLGGVDTGKYLIAGGAGQWGNTTEYDWDQWEADINTITDHVFVFNPDDGATEEVVHQQDSRLRHFGYSAFGASAAMPDGGGIWWGGWADQMDVRENEILEILPGGLRETEAVPFSTLQDPDLFNLSVLPGCFGAAAVKTEAGALICGGGSVNVDETLASTDTCILVENANKISAFSNLPQSLAGATLTLLEDGRLLLVGGATMSVPPDMVDGLYFHYFSDPYPASDQVWLYDGRWSKAGTLPQPVAGHTTTLLPDGRVLILGVRIIMGTTPIPPRKTELRLQPAIAPPFLTRPPATAHPCRDAMT